MRVPLNLSKAPVIRCTERPGWGVAALLCLVAVGCATTGTDGPVPIGPNLYMIGGLGGFTDFSSSGVKARMFREGNAFCAKQGRTMLPTSDTGKDSDLGKYASAEVQFYCLLPNDPRLSR